MKKYLFSLIFAFGLITSAQAQFDVDKLFGGVHLGYTKPIGDFSDFAKGGLYFNGVLGYKLKESIWVGGLYQASLTGAVDAEGDSGIFGINIYSLDSYLLKAWYTFSQGNVKPYASIGLGLASVSEPDIEGTDADGNPVTISGAKRTGLGGQLEIGLMMNSFNISYSFNMGGKTPEAQLNGAQESLDVFYHSFSLGYTYYFGE